MQDREALKRSIRGAVIDRDESCVKCGYNLRGLATGSVCPECGVTVRSKSTRFGWTMVDAPIPWLTRFRTGCLFLIMALFVGAATELLSIAFFFAMIISPKFRMADAELLFVVYTAAQTVAGACWCCGVMIVTAPRPRSENEGGEDEWRRLRMLARWTHAAWVACFVVVKIRLIYGVLMGIGGASLAGPLGMADSVIAVAEWVWVPAGLVGVSFAAVYFSRLAAWAPDEDIATAPLRAPFTLLGGVLMLLVIHWIASIGVLLSILTAPVWIGAAVAMFWAFGRFWITMFGFAKLGLWAKPCAIERLESNRRRREKLIERNLANRSVGDGDAAAAQRAAGPGEAALIDGAAIPLADAPPGESKIIPPKVSIAKPVRGPDRKKGRPA